MRLPFAIQKIQNIQKKLLWPRAKIVFAGLFCFFVVLGNVGWAPADNISASTRKSATRNFIQREGARIVACRGYFRMAGGRVVFFPTERKNRYIALENLNLERVMQTLADQSGQRRWRVTGTLTEFQGKSYLLVEKALLESWDST